MRGSRVCCKKCERLFVVDDEETPPPPVPQEREATPAEPPPVVVTPPRASGPLALVLLLVGVVLGVGVAAGILAVSQTEPPRREKVAEKPPPPPRETSFGWHIKGAPFDRPLADVPFVPPPVKPIPELPPERAPAIETDDPPPKLEQPTRGLPLLENWLQVRPGMTEAEVVALLGKTFDNTGTTTDGFWRYRIAAGTAAVSWKDGKGRMDSATDGVPLVPPVKSLEEKARKVFADLKEDQPGALAEMAKTTYVPEIAADVARELERLARKGPGPRRQLALDAMKRWPARENVPYLLTIFDETPAKDDPSDPVLQAQKTALDIMIELHDYRAAGPIVKLARTKTYRGQLATLPVLCPADLADWHIARLIFDAEPELHRFACDRLPRFRKPELHIAQAIRALSSPVAKVRFNGVEFLAGAIQPREVDEARQKVIAGRLAESTSDPDETVSKMAVSALKAWGGSESLPVLLAGAPSRKDATKRLAEESARSVVERMSKQN